ncbi:hypothetical protein HK105_201497 [Polyrhizophydium stewartii]|uniref:Ankyrin repeat protein n=1 Tax=Polyrhizophydium stewartii TaxID=2732419 RepID=A0ABR4NGK3_9FUNG
MEKPIQMRHAQLGAAKLAPIIKSDKLVEAPGAQGAVGSNGAGAGTGGHKKAILKSMPDTDPDDTDTGAHEYAPAGSPTTRLGMTIPIPMTISPATIGVSPAIVTSGASRFTDPARLDSPSVIIVPAHKSGPHSAQGVRNAAVGVSSVGLGVGGSVAVGGTPNGVVPSGPPGTLNSLGIVVGGSTGNSQASHLMSPVSVGPAGGGGFSGPSVVAQGTMADLAKRPSLQQPDGLDAWHPAPGHRAQTPARPESSAAKRVGIASSMVSIAHAVRQSEAARPSADQGISGTSAGGPAQTGVGTPNPQSMASQVQGGAQNNSSVASIDNFRGEGSKLTRILSAGSINAMAAEGPDRPVNSNVGPPNMSHLDRHIAVSEDRLSHVSVSEMRNTGISIVPSMAPGIDLRARSKESTKRLQKPSGQNHRLIGLNAHKASHEITLPQFDEYPIVQGNAAAGGIGSQREPRAQKFLSKTVMENPEMFEQMFPTVIPIVNNEAVALKLMHLYNSRWPRRSIRMQLPPITPENMRMFLFHLARIGDLEALKVICKSPLVDLEASDDAGRTALIFAAIGGHAQCVRLLTSYHAFVNRQDRSGRTAMHWAAYHGYLSVAKELSDSHADMIQEDYQGKSPIHCATYPETVETLEFLVKTVTPVARRGTIMSLAPMQRRKTVAGLVFPEDRSGPCNALDLENMTPLMWAAYHGHDKHIEVLLASGRASAFIQDIEGKTALHWATSNRHGRCCDILLAKFPALINIPDRMGRVPLHYACGEGNIAVVERILFAPGSNPNALDGLKRTPLHWAAVRGHPACINLLCQNGANINLLDEYGASVLCYAIQERNMDCVHVLLRKGAAVNSADIHGRTPLMWASLQGNVEVIKMLIKANSKVLMRDKSGMTALHHAAYAGHTVCCTHLLRSGAITDVKDKHEQTALFKATMKGWENVVTLLANEGANVDEVDHHQRTACHWAACGGFTHIMQLLMSHGANINARDIAKRTPLHEAALAGYADVVTLLLQNDVDARASDIHGATPLHLAASRGHAEICLELASYVEVNARDGADVFKSKTALDYAKESRSEECC